MPESFIQLPVDSTGKMLRHRQRAIGANTVYEPYMIPISERVATNHGIVTTFRTIGAAATTQNLFTIQNTTGSTTLIGVRRLTVQLDATAVLTAVMPQVKSYRMTGGSTGGTTLTKNLVDSTETPNASVVCRGATASDGGAATAITATPGTVIWQQYCMRMHTVVGQVLGIDNTLLPTMCETEPLILRPNEGLLVQVVAAVTTSNPATNHWFVQCMWDEFTYP